MQIVILKYLIEITDLINATPDLIIVFINIYTRVLVSRACCNSVALTSIYSMYV